MASEDDLRSACCRGREHKYSPKLETLDAVQEQAGIPFAPFREGRQADVRRTPTGEDEQFALVPVYEVEESVGIGVVTPEVEVIAYGIELPMWSIRTLTVSPVRYLQIISVKGVSMLPTLKPGDLV